jgi:2-dehydropantoate 2-reductase
MTAAERPIAVLGAGAVGSILAANFAAIEQKVLLLETAAARADQVERGGLTVTGKQSVSARPAQVLRSLEELRGHQPLALFICSKTWSLKGILPELKKVLDPDTLVVSFQNGIGVEDELASFFPPDRVARGIVNYAGGVAPDTGAVNMAWFTPPNYLGPYDDGSAKRVELVAEILDRSQLSTRAIPSSETKKRVFYKTILNSALNALCAMNGITMRQAMTFRHTRNLASMLIREGLSVAAAVGYNYGENAREAILRYLDGGGDHLPSMWHDLQRGLPTEIEYINGKIVKIGLMFKNVDVDANMFFTSMIITQEIKNGVRDPEDIPEYLTNY